MAIFYQHMREMAMSMPGGVIVPMSRSRFGRLIPETRPLSTKVAEFGTRSESGSRPESGSGLNI